MTPQLRRIIAEFLAFAGDNWRIDIAAGLLQVWIEELSELPTANVETALKQFRRGKFMPNLGDVYEAANAITPDKQRLEAARQRLIATRIDFSANASSHDLDTPEEIRQRVARTLREKPDQLENLIAIGDAVPWEALKK
jgi:hypothetical protein